MRDEIPRVSDQDSPPEQITLIYREVGQTHVFSAQGFRGFHVGSHSLDDAYKLALPALGEHVSALFDAAVTYSAGSLASFKKRLKKDITGPLVIVTLMPTCTDTSARV